VILTAIGDIPLGSVDNLTVRPLIEKMCAAKLSPRTVNKYVEHVKQVVESLKAANGEPLHKRSWDADTMDLPIVHFSEQRRPTLRQDVVSSLIADSSGQEQALYVLLAATGLRISEALAVETRHIINGGRTIVVEQQVEKNHPRIVRYLKTDAATREVDLHPDVAEYLQRYAAGKSGLLFSTESGTPHLYGNLANRWLMPPLAKLGLDEKGMGWHAFKRFRKTWIRGARCLEDLNNFWMAHKPQTMSEVYSHLHEDIEMRLVEAERVGYGFTLPTLPPAVVPIVPKLHQNSAVGVAA
jgi:integrase